MPILVAQGPRWMTVGSMAFLFVLVITVGFISTPTTLFRQTSNQTNTSKGVMKEEVQTEHMKHKMEETLRQLRRENIELKAQVESLNHHKEVQLKAQLESLKQQKQEQTTTANLEKNHNNPKIDDLSKTLHQLVTYKQRMHEAIQKLSRRNLRTKYGNGPYRVSMNIEFDPKSNVYSFENPGGTITIELASANDMPATVYFFLEQVSFGLWNNCSFHRNAEHVIQSGLEVNFKQAHTREKDFHAAHLFSIPFQEYSPNFPHVPYTLGYAGRPGGPDFYISLIDNTENHGPGGQEDYDDPTEADPCFGKVIDGFDVVHRMHQSEVQPGDYNAMKYNIAILNITILTEPVESRIAQS